MLIARRLDLCTCTTWQFLCVVFLSPTSNPRSNHALNFSECMSQDKPISPISSAQCLKSALLVRACGSIWPTQRHVCSCLTRCSCHTPHHTHMTQRLALRKQMIKPHCPSPWMLHSCEHLPSNYSTFRSVIASNRMPFIHRANCRATARVRVQSLHTSVTRKPLSKRSHPTPLLAPTVTLSLRIIDSCVLLHHHWPAVVCIRCDDTLMIRRSHTLPYIQTLPF